MKTMENNPFTIVGMADKDIINEGQQKIEFGKTQRKSIAVLKQARADAHFERLGLKKNKRYDGKGYKVLIKYRGGLYRWENLIRTTPKSIYIRSFGYKNDERRININVINEIKG